jgi:uracil-DNA glycosylase
MTDQRVIIIGQAPGRANDGGPAFLGRSGRRLAELSGVPFQELSRVFDLRNLLKRWPGRSKGKGDRFPVRAARAAALAAAPALKGRKVILVGRGVAAAFSGGEGRSEFFRWREGEGLPFERATVPHPSGVNLWWNDPENRGLAETFFRGLVAGPS